ncbi:MAG: hypothetical protein JXR95_00940 [Deltaproteobacteria bacterium]|nr:hypothetical protein [Deltaproteobacteria bacterium]
MGRIYYDDLLSDDKASQWRKTIIISIIQSAVVFLLIHFFHLFTFPVPYYEIMTSHKSPLNNLLTAAAIFLVSGGFGIFSIPWLNSSLIELKKNLSRGGYQSIEAVITNIWLEEYMGENGMVYSPAMSISYTFDSEKYKATGNISNSRHNIMFLHKRTLKKYPPGSGVIVYIHPDNPENFRFRQPSVFSSIGTLTASLVTNMIFASGFALAVYFFSSGIYRLF